MLQEYKAQDLPLACIPGGRMMYQLASAEADGVKYAVVALGMANPFLSENLRSVLLHWGCTEGVQAQWTQPPHGWHSSPGVSTVRGAMGAASSFCRCWTSCQRHVWHVLLAPAATCRQAAALR